MNKKNFYITTPIYYPSSKLHIGHAYTTTLADILARYKRQQNYNVFFLTGSDEHGEKIQKKAQEVGLAPLQFTDKIVENFKFLWSQLGIKYNKFIRTTEINHEQTVQKIFSYLVKNNDVYLGNYQGWYCISCEEYLTESQYDSATKRCLICHNELKLITEETYFFKVSKYQNFLLNYFNHNLDFITPEAAKNEMINNFIKPGLTDLSVTRTSFTWGIKTLENYDHIIYVWIDALSNYLTGLGYLSEDDKLFQQYWNNEDVEIVQLLGKEIARFHTIYWPSLLESLNLRQANHLLIHGWILFKDSKMSKSLGNIVDPLYLISKFGADALRFYLAYEIPTDRDGKFSYEMYLESYNTHLVNNIGNLVSRVSNMITKYFDGKLILLANFDNDLTVKSKLAVKKFIEYMDKYQISKAIVVVIQLFSDANKYIETEKPWELAKSNNQEKMLSVLASLAQAIVVGAFLLQPVLINNAQKIADFFSIDLNLYNYDTILDFNIFNNKQILKKENLFMRLDLVKELEKIILELGVQ